MTKSIPEGGEGGGGTRDEYVLFDELLLGAIVWHVFF